MYPPATMEPLKAWLMYVEGLSQPNVLTQASPSLDELHGMSYARVARGRVRSNLPSAAQAEALFELDQDLFTPDAAVGMRECGFKGH